MEIKTLTEKEYKSHLKEIGIDKTKADEIWDSVILRRKQTESIKTKKRGKNEKIPNG
jgi:hypothetical protein